MNGRMQNRLARFEGPLQTLPEGCVLDVEIVAF
jgi:hypothetical protein